MTLQIIGRSSSHFTRVALIFAHELGVAVELVPVADLVSRDIDHYGNPALKIPTLRRGQSSVFGAENICRALAEVAATPRRIVWPEELRDDRLRNAQELVWYSMAAQVQLVFGTILSKLPADNVYFVKARAGFEGALCWLDEHVDGVLGTLPQRDLSLLEVTLFCLIDHLAFRATVPVEPYPALRQFAAEFGKRASAQATAYRFDSAAAAPVK